MKNKIKAVRSAIKINFYIAMLIFAYYLLGVVILKGQLFILGTFLYSLFYINCFVVGVKIVLENKKN